MQLVVIVLNKTECLEDMLEGFMNINVRGATIIDSTGMAHTLSENGYSFLGSLRMFMDPDHVQSKTVLCVVDDDLVPQVSRVVNEVTGGLDKPDSGILFALPISYAKGIHKGKD